MLTLFSCLQDGFRARAAQQAEILALRHQLLVLQRSRRGQAMDPDQQVFGQVRSLQQWIERMPEYSYGQLVSAMFAAFSFLAVPTENSRMVKKLERLEIVWAYRAQRFGELQLLFAFAIGI